MDLETEYFSPWRVRLDFTVYAVNRLPFVKASCRSLNAPPSHGRAVHHPFVAFFTSFARAKAAACWLSESGEEVYVHRFRANKSVEGRWHPFRPGQSINHPTQMCHYAATGLAFRDWPVERELAADTKSCMPHREPVPAFLVGVNAAPGEEAQWQHYNFFTVGVFTSEQRAKACVAERGHCAVSVCPIQLNAPLSPCLSSAVLSAHQTRLLVRSAMMFVDYSEDCEREGGVMSDIMAQVWGLVLDRHQHPHRAKTARRMRAAAAQVIIAAEEAPPVKRQECLEGGSARAGLQQLLSTAGHCNFEEMVLVSSEQVSSQKVLSISDSLFDSPLHETDP